MPDLTIGSRGTLTIATRGKDGPGEVQVDGGETFIAYSAEPIPRGMARCDLRHSRRAAGRRRAADNHRRLRCWDTECPIRMRPCSSRAVRRGKAMPRSAW